MFAKNAGIGFRISAVAGVGITRLLVCSDPGHSVTVSIVFVDDRRGQQEEGGKDMFDLKKNRKKCVSGVTLPLRVMPRVKQTFRSKPLQAILVRKADSDSTSRISVTDDNEPPATDRKRTHEEAFAETSRLATPPFAPPPKTAPFLLAASDDSPVEVMLRDEEMVSPNPNPTPAPTLAPTPALTLAPTLAPTPTL